MKIIGIIFILLMFVRVASASQHQYLNSLGSSVKGQFTALEEYGYTPAKHVYYVKIRFINVWTSEDVGSVISVEIPALHPALLVKARGRAKDLSRDQFEKYKIISH